MHSLFFFMILAIGVFGIMAGSPEDDRKKIINDCKVAEKATEDDAQQLLNRKLPKGPNAKCLLACVYEKTGIIKDKKVQPEALKAMLLNENGGNQKAIKQITDTVNECKSVNHAERCELASLLKGCLDKAAVIHGFN